MLQIIVLAGGAGVQLWPLSREKMPKQFLKILDNDTNLFQNTIQRIINVRELSSLKDEKIRIVVVCNDNNKFMVKKQIEEITKDIDFIIIAEPINRNTTIAISIALELSNKNDDILVVPTDQIWDDNQFANCVEEMIFKKYNGITFIGITPYYPATRFGYINVNGNKLVSFKEKPDSDLAKEYVNNKTNNYLWNSGILFFKSKIMLDEINKNYKNIINQSKLILQNSFFNNNIISLNKSLFSNVESISIDCAILENYKNGYVVKYNNYWTDIDGFKSLYDYLQKDKDYNLIQSNSEDNVISIDTKNTYIYSEHKLVSTLGIENLVIVDTHDSLLVASRDFTPKISEIVKTLKSQGRSEHIINPVCYKPWGWYLTLSGNDHSGHKVKKICVYPKKRLSLQSHKDRSEHWVIIKGQAKVQIGNDYHNLIINQTVYIPKGVIHRLENIGEDNVEFIETQIGEYLGEDDIIRYEDDFGR